MKNLTWPVKFTCTGPVLTNSFLQRTREENGDVPPCMFDEEYFEDIKFAYICNEEIGEEQATNHHWRP